MKLCKSMAHICIRAINAHGQLKKQVDDYFKNSQYGRFGYHATQLAAKHKLIFPLAARMSAIFNLWLDQLNQLAGSIPAVLLTRLQRCAKSYSTLTDLVSTCDSKLCPLCRAVKIIEIEGRLASLAAQGCTQTDFAASGTIKVPRSHSEAILTVKNVLWLDTGPTLRMVQFYQEMKPGRTALVKGLIKDLLQYDYRILFSLDARNQWMAITRDMNFFSRKYGTRPKLPA